MYCKNSRAKSAKRSIAEVGDVLRYPVSDYEVLAGLPPISSRARLSPHFVPAVSLCFIVISAHNGRLIQRFSCHPGRQNNITLMHSMESSSQPTFVSLPGSARPPQELNHATKRIRASKACRRCRRLRIKCKSEGGLPCQTCRSADHDCSFPRRGEPDHDRSYRRQPAHSSQPRSSSIEDSRVPSGSTATSSNRDENFSNVDPVLQPATDLGHNLEARPSDWDLLPPHEEVLQSCEVFTTSYFQLGFVPKALFFERLNKHPESMNVFLLLSILSISARFTPNLVMRYGSGGKATEIFLQRAGGLVFGNMYEPSLEAIQAFFLLSIAEWGNGEKHRSSMHMGIAIRMAGLLRLHREETYRLPDHATANQIVDAEVARRTFWMLENYENLHSGYSSPISFSYQDITVLLPCDERDFSFGVIPSERAALMGTPAAAEHEASTRSKSRSLFATLIQAHNLWGQVARAVSNEVDRAKSGPRIDPEDYTRLSEALSEWEEDLPPQHKWSVWNLRGCKAERVDLAYLSVVMVVRLSNIILRRGCLHEILDSSRDLNVCIPSQRPDTMTVELFQNVLILNEQIEAFFELRSPEQGYPALIVFCVYICGSLANHLFRQPRVCLQFAPRAEEILRKSMTVLHDLQHAWPLARRWYAALCNACAGTTIANHPNRAYRLGMEDVSVIPSNLGRTQQLSNEEGLFQDLIATDFLQEVQIPQSWRELFTDELKPGSFDMELAASLWAGRDA